MQEEVQVQEQEEVRESRLLVGIEGIRKLFNLNTKINQQTYQLVYIENVRKIVYYNPFLC